LALQHKNKEIANGRKTNKQMINLCSTTMEAAKGKTNLTLLMLGKSMCSKSYTSW